MTQAILNAGQDPGRRWELPRPLPALVIGWLILTCPYCVQANDYFLVIAGGYSPQGNQASLEANVLFFQDVLQEQHHSSRNVATFFADGYDDSKDLQVALGNLAESQTPATDLLVRLHATRGPSQYVEYRNHRVPNIAGPLRPNSIENCLTRFASKMKAGDRFFVYVTAHGGSAKGSNKYNTSISCWGKQKISANQFENWLDQVPEEVPVIMVMAQCYCGGFAHTIFDDVDSEGSLSAHRRVGFFAQQHDLAAAGCRPDIQNDAEYSSYFWGAIAGRTRNGKPTENVDLDGDGRVSLAEAHAYALLASETIDIPLRTSESLLRKYSRIGNYQQNAESDESETQEDDIADNAPGSSSDEWIELAELTGSFEQIAAQARSDQKPVIAGLVRQLEMEMTDPITDAFEGLARLRKQRVSRRPSFGRRGRGSGRRTLLGEIEEIYPDLAEDNWRESELLLPENQQALFSELAELPSYTGYAQFRARYQEMRSARSDNEIQKVKYQRLIHALESVVLAQNLPVLADQEVNDRYQDMLVLEESFLQPNVQTTGLRAY